jgi:hypothetical protein
MSPLSSPTRSGQLVDCRITGVQPFGFFATVEKLGGDGLVPAATLGTEYFRYDEKAQALVGEQSGETYRQGQRLKLRIAEANPVSGGLRFELPEGSYGGAKPADRRDPCAEAGSDAAGRRTFATATAGAEAATQPLRVRFIDRPRREPMAYKIAILVGSLRKESINRKVARSICAIRNDNLDCDMVEIGDLPLYNQDHDGDPPQEYVRFRDRIRKSDGVLFVTPEYNREHSGRAEERDRRRLASLRKERVRQEAGGDHHRFAGRDRRLRCQSPPPPVLRVPQHAGDGSSRKPISAMSATTASTPTAASRMGRSRRS